MYNISYYFQNIIDNIITFIQQDCSGILIKMGINNISWDIELAG